MPRIRLLPRAVAVASALVVLGLGAGCAKKNAGKAGCSKDTDCKGSRVCEAGRCVDPSGTPPAATAEKSGGKTPPAAAPAPGGSGALIPRPPAPGGGSGSGGGLAAGDIQICIGPKCIDLGGGAGQDPAALMDVLKDLMLGGLMGGGGTVPDVKVCIQGDCTTLDDQMLKDPQAMMKILGKLGPLMMQQLFSGGGGGGFPFGGGGGASPRPRPAPGGAVAFKDLTSLLAAGRDAAGRVAEVGGLTINSVTDNRLVLEGPAQEMIVLTIPPSLKSEVPRLRVATQKVAVRLQVSGAPVGKLIRGELVSVN